jgi:predicted RNA-binding Zn-ribbon protein involved in translation (DUF1610 family)
MMIESTSRVSVSRALATADLSRPNCPRCGSVQLVAEESRFSTNGRIEHDWSCDDCGHAFATSIRLRRR